MIFMLSEALKIVILVIEALLFIYFFLTTVYFLIFSIAGLFPLNQPIPTITKLNRFVVLIPGYKEDKIIIEVARQALDQDYPSGLFDVVVIADSFTPGTLAELKKLPVKVLEVLFENSSKARSLKEAMKILPSDYNAVIILDADNVMERDFISLINNSFNLGYKSVQAHRTSKNQNTSFAILDTISEEINNQIFRKGHWITGLSSALIGSGMAFDYNMFRDYIMNMDFILGEEKELEMRMIRDRVKIAYLNDAFVYDEKVQESDVFMVQRARWLATQFIFARLYFLPGIREFFKKGNVDFLDKVIQQFLPPRIFLLGFLILISVLSAILNPLACTFAWLGLTVTCILTLLFSTPKRFYNIRTLKAVFRLPEGFFMMLVSLSRMYKAQKKWDHTVHGINS
jgi:cellulose synthase/poly-beta-1,6-N-acetylglucosamine synthase-like glycosyltransferase